MRSSRPIRRGDLYWIEWRPSRGLEQDGTRPSLVVQADYITEAEGRSLIVLALSTGSHGDDALHVSVEPSRVNGLTHAGVVKCEQIMTVDRARLRGYIGILEPRYLEKVEHSLRMILGLAGRG